MPSEIHNAILRGLQSLIALRLRGCPSEDTVQSTVMVWIDTLSYAHRWDKSDLPRVQTSFRRLASECNEWPTPRMFLDRLPPRPPPKQLPPPELDDAEREEVQRQLDALVKALKINGDNNDQN